MLIGKVILKAPAPLDGYVVARRFGCNGATYTLVAADSGQSITFEVTPVAATGTTTGSAVNFQRHHRNQQRTSCQCSQYYRY